MSLHFEAVDTFANRGTKISERLLRKQVREIGACRIFGNTMYLFSEDVEPFIEASRLSSRT